MVFGQMNEPPGVRLARGVDRPTMAEYFATRAADVLLFIDNIFRFVMSGSEVSRSGPDAFGGGYQPTLSTEMASCRSASPRPSAQHHFDAGCVRAG